MVKHYCDRCEKQIGQILKEYPYREARHKASHNDDIYEFCGTCYTKATQIWLKFLEVEDL